MSIKFFKNKSRNKDCLKVNSVNEFNVFKDVILFSKREVYKEMKYVLDDIDKKIDKQMAEAIEKYHIVVGLKKQIEDISIKLTGDEEEIIININGSKEANIIARYSEKMLQELLNEGFSSSDEHLERKAMTVTYSKRIMMKLDNIAKKYLNSEDNVDYEEDEFKEIEEKEESNFEKFNNISEKEKSADSIEQNSDDINSIRGYEIYNDEESSMNDETNAQNEGGIEMFDEKYSKEAYELFVKGSDEEIIDDVERVGEEAYDTIIKEVEDDKLRKNKDIENVSEKAYNEYVKNGRKIKEVEDDESYNG